MKTWVQLLIVLAVIVSTIGCSQQQVTESDVSSDATDRTKFLLGAEPQSAMGVIEVRENAQQDEPVVVVGRIGGSENPWVEGRAAFSVVDLQLLACSDQEGDDCQTPWDYCCETDRLAQATVLVKLVDESGQLVAVDSRELLGLKELQTVVAEGLSQRDEAGNVTVLASGVYIKP